MPHEYEGHDKPEHDKPIQIKLHGTSFSSMMSSHETSVRGHGSIGSSAVLAFVNTGPDMPLGQKLLDARKLVTRQRTGVIELSVDRQDWRNPASP